MHLSPCDACRCWIVCVCVYVLQIECMFLSEYM